MCGMGTWVHLALLLRCCEIPRAYAQQHTQEVIRLALENFYSKHSPAKLLKLRAALAHFEGREGEFVQQIEAKYNDKVDFTTAQQQWDNHTCALRSMIPLRIIYLFGFWDDGPMPPKMRNTVRLNKRFVAQHTVYNKSHVDALVKELDAEKVPGLQHVYSSLRRRVAQADIGRYVVMYLHGGIYLDLDCRLLKPIPAELLSTRHLLLFHESTGTPRGKREDRTQTTRVANFAMASRKGNLFLLELLKLVVERCTELGFDDAAVEWEDGDVLWATGPDAVTSAWYKGRWQANATSYLMPAEDKAATLAHMDEHSWMALGDHSTSGAAKIPKIIFQTWKTAELPARVQRFAARVRDLHPDFEIRFFDDADIDAFVRGHFPQHIVAKFESFAHPIQKVDLWRMLAVHRHGGFYLDLDVELSEPLHSLANFQCVFPFEKTITNDPTFHMLRNASNVLVGQYAFGAVAGHPFVGAVIDNIVSGRLDAFVGNQRKDVEIVLTTGPGIVTQTLIERKGYEGGETVKVLFPDPELRGVKGWFRFGAYGRHHMDGSWRPEMPESCRETLEQQAECEARAGPSFDECIELKSRFETCMETELDMAVAFKTVTG